MPDKVTFRASICLARIDHLEQFGISTDQLIPCHKKIFVVGGDSTVPCSGWIPAKFVVCDKTTLDKLL